jgi:methylthioribose-1-phosphate isomerase
MFDTIRWTGSAVELLNQTQLPTRTVYVTITDERQMHDAIRRLVVRGAPVIGVSAAFGAYLGIQHAAAVDAKRRLSEVCNYLATSRPTAVNLFWALKRIRDVGECADTGDVKRVVLEECLAMLDEDERCCRAIGEHGAALLKSLAKPDTPLNVLTHCNAGSCVAVRWGTALAPIYVGVEQGLRFHVYADETRPLMQGSRITAYELQQNAVPVTVLCDNMAASLMSHRKLDCVIVGADRIAANGDVANKIGTLGVAILARHFKIPFFVAAPISTIDLATATGADIPIEHRDAKEVTHPLGAVQSAPAGVDVFNPAFDVTPAALVDAIITENGVIRAPYSQNLKHEDTKPRSGR